MKLSLKNLTASLAAIAVVATPALAHATEFFLIGTRHVYLIGNSPYLNVDQRFAAEQQYADAVAAAQASYDGAIAAGQDTQIAVANLQDQLDRAAQDRDTQLSILYTPEDQIIATHPEFSLVGDGPYQVLEVETARPVFVEYKLWLPWVGYRVEPGYYGWKYGRTYHHFDEFHGAHVAWLRDYAKQGQPIFVGKLTGTKGPITISLSPVKIKHILVQGNGNGNGSGLPGVDGPKGPQGPDRGNKKDGPESGPKGKDPVKGEPQKKDGDVKGKNK